MAAVHLSLGPVPVELVGSALLDWTGRAAGTVGTLAPALSLTEGPTEQHLLPELTSAPLHSLPVHLSLNTHLGFLCARQVRCQGTEMRRGSGSQKGKWTWGGLTPSGESTSGGDV